MSRLFLDDPAKLMRFVRRQYIPNDQIAILAIVSDLLVVQSRGLADRRHNRSLSVMTAALRMLR